MDIRNTRKLGESIKKQVAYRQQYKCSSCLLLLPPSYQIDHIIPHSISGDDTIDNLTALCPNCHSNKTQKE
jgi:5-methylcytosine-specific restriction endonuclease McrA